MNFLNQAKSALSSTNSGSTTGSTTAGTGTTATTGNGDALDKGLDQAFTKSGHTQSHANVEKASDGVRTLFKKATGKDVPVKDDTYA